MNHRESGCPNVVTGRLDLLALTLLLAGCSHAEPFASGKPVANGPFTSSRPLQMTLNIGNDQWPIWTADGARIIYSAQDSMAPDRDQCLVTMPGTGGTFASLRCPSPIQNNVTEVPQQPTILDGRLAYAIADLGTFPPEHVQYRFNIWTASLTSNDIPQRVMRFPYDAPSGKAHDGPIDLRWVRPGLLAYIGFEAGCCNKDTLRFGEQIVLLQISGDTGIRTFVPDTYRASSLGVATDGLSIYYTFYGDSRVYRRVLATNEVTVIHDFGPGQVIRYPDIVGNRMVAVIRGQHNFGNSPPFDSVSVDRGGVLMVLDLITGDTSAVVNQETWFKHPRLSPAGDRIVAEGFPYSVDTTYIMETDTIARIDTLVGRSPDIWLLEE